MKFAIISDIHANAPALGQVCRTLKSCEIDQVIVLGDLLTYGCDALMVLEMLELLANSYPIKFIKGNHDQFYFDLQAGGEVVYTKSLPDFIKESIDWTLDNLSDHLLDQFDWVESYTYQRCLFAHANPLPYPNWMYLNKPEEYAISAEQLMQQGFACGIFGHTHRAGCVEFQQSQMTVLPGCFFEFDVEQEGVVYLCNPGSVGQPRAKGSSSFAVMNIDANVVQYEIIPIHYDVEAHQQSIQYSSLSAKTKHKLISYFKV